MTPGSSSADSIHLGQTSHLARLPTELLQRIFNMLEDVIDAISLCVTCKCLLSVGHRACSDWISRITGPNAGDRIICIRDYRLGGIPAATKQNSTAWTYERTSENQGLIDLVGVYESLNAEVENQLPMVSTNKCSQVDYLLESAPIEKLSQIEYLLFDRFINPSENPESLWVLCNLSKRQYVCAGRSQSLASLGEILVSQTFWSPDPHTRTWDGAGERGDWVSDRFEITTLDRLKGGPESWMNVGKKLRIKLSEIKGSTWFKKERC